MGSIKDPQDELSVSPPKTYASGLPAVAHALQYSLSQNSIRRTALTLLNINQVKSFDCPGCARPEGKHRPKNEYCENGAKHINDETTTNRVTDDVFCRNFLVELGAKSDCWLNPQGRLTEPMVKRPGGTHYERITWQDVFGLIADELRALESPDEAMFYTSGRLNNEAAFLLQVFSRVYGTDNLPDCSNKCNEPSGSALGETLGIGKGSVSLEDIHESDLVFVVGQNPGTNHPWMLSALEETKRNGGKVVAVNTLPEAGLIRFKNPQKARGVIGRGTAIADQFLQIRPGGDLALFQILNRLLLEAEDAAPGTVLDRDFIESDSRASRTSPSTRGRSAGTTCSRRPGCHARRSNASTSGCWRAGRSSCVGRWDSPSTSRASRPSGRWSTPCCCAATWAHRGQGCARYTATATSRAAPPWASGSRCPRSSWRHKEFEIVPPTGHGYDSVNGVRAMRDEQATSGGVHRAAGSGVAAGVLVTGAVAEWLPHPMVLPCLAHTLLALLVWAASREVPETVVRRRAAALPAPDPDLRRVAVQDPRFLRVVLPASPSVFEAATVAYVVLPPLVIAEAGGYAPLISGPVAAVTISVGLAVQPVAAWLDHPGSAWSSLVAVATVIVGMLTGAGAVRQGSAAMVLGAVVVMGACYGLTLAAGVKEIERLAPPQALGTAASLYQGVTYSCFLAPLVLAVTASAAAYPILLAGIAGVGLMFLVLAAVYSRRDLPDVAGTPSTDRRRDEPLIRSAPWAE